MMAQRIQTVCDVHAERGEDVDASSWEVLVRKAGSRSALREVDLCSECAQVLESVAAFAAENGRTVQQPTPKARAAVTPAASSVTPAKPAKGGMASCPVEGCGSVVQASNLGRHVRNVHGLSAVPDADAAAVYPCPDC